MIRQADRVRGRRKEEVEETDRWTDTKRQTENPTDRQKGGRQTDKETGADRWTDKKRQTDNVTDRQKDVRQTDKETGTRRRVRLEETDRRYDRESDRQAGETDRWTDEQGGLCRSFFCL